VAIGQAALDIDAGHRQLGAADVDRQRRLHWRVNLTRPPVVSFTLERRNLTRLTHTTEDCAVASIETAAPGSNLLRLLRQDRL
jgi:hypothetical protein